MASLTIIIPDEIEQRVINGICNKFNYSPTLEDGTQNPESKPAYAKRMIISFMKQSVRDSETQTAKNNAATTVSQSVDADIVLS